VSNQFLLKIIHNL